MRVLLILLSLAATSLAVTTYQLTHSISDLQPPALQMQDELNTPVTATKDNVTLTTTVTTVRQEGETDPEFAARHLALVEATIEAYEDLGYTVGSGGGQ